MVRRLFDFNAPDRFVADAVGEPGSRTFYLQARQGGAVVTLGMEKVHLAALTGRLAGLLDVEIGTGAAGASGEAAARDDAPLEAPLIEVFRVGAISLAWDNETDSVVIEAQPGNENGEFQLASDDDMAGPDQLRVRIAPSRARDFVRRAAGLVAAGRPSCPFCGQPLEAGGHFCARTNLN
jgi:uncharacterized repeat protein (TIGR03847 family)